MSWGAFGILFVVTLVVVIAVCRELRGPLWGSPSPHAFGSTENDDEARFTSRRVRRQRWLVLLAAVILTATAVARIISTYHVFNNTMDEPAHIAAGVEWLQVGTYGLDPSQPPLARLCIALGPYLEGLRLSSGASWIEVGDKILYADGHYFQTLKLARLGVLPFFLLATAVVFIWAQKVFGNACALLAVLLFTTLPPVLGHAGMATTDVAITATYATAMLLFTCFLERPTYFGASVLGLSFGLAISSKLSALVFLPASGLALFVCYRLAGGEPLKRWFAQRRRIPVVAAFVLLMTSFVVWDAYRFSVHVARTGKTHDRIDALVGATGPVHRLAYFLADRVPIPAPEFIIGFRDVELHDLWGHNSYLLGQVRRTGWWYFFPVVLAVKSPLPFLILTSFGLAALARQLRRGADWRAHAPAAMALAILAVCMPSRIDLGVRHILPIYPLLAIVAGFGAYWLWNADLFRYAARAAVVVLLLWQIIVCVRIHPDYLAYFNALAGRSPDRVLVEGDLDWGQDLQRLGNVLQERNIDSVALLYHGTAEPSQHIHARWWNLQPCEFTTGWVAISEMRYKMGDWAAGEPPKPAYRYWAWLDAYTPVAMVGKSIRLYYIPQLGTAPASSEIHGTKACP